MRFETERYTLRFSGRVAAYAAYRPHFPKDILPFLRGYGALPEGAVVADIGAGTGMLAEVFLEAGHPVVAVEPNGEMLEACGELAARYPGLRLVQASAEATMLPDASVDLIAVGRAMHWFDWPHAHREFQRILRPGGWVLVATNGHRNSGAIVSEELSAITRRWRMDSAEADTRREFDSRLKSFFDVEGLQGTKLYYAMTVTFEVLLGYVESLSAIPRMGERGYGEMVAELRDLFDRYQRGGFVETPLICQLYLGRLSGEYVAPFRWHSAAK